jgi:glutamine synthetase adenylyltransferase
VPQITFYDAGVGADSGWIDRVVDGVTGRGLDQNVRDGYRFLSEVRNRLYLLRHRDVDVLPPSQPKLETLARSMGYGRGGWQEREDDRQRHARHVRGVCERLFYGM